MSGRPLLAVWLADSGARAVTAALSASLPPLGIFAGVHLFRPAQQRAWQTFGLGSAAIAAAVVGFALADLFRIPIPTPSPLYGVLTLGLVLELIGLVGIVRGRVRLGLPDLVDVSVLVTGLAVVAWFAIFDPALFRARPHQRSDARSSRTIGPIRLGPCVRCALRLRIS